MKNVVRNLLLLALCVLLNCTTKSAKPTEIVPPPTRESILKERVRNHFSKSCSLELMCDNIIGIDCGSAYDGPYYYVRESDFETVATCGGHCMVVCDNCPPKGLRNCINL